MVDLLSAIPVYLLTIAMLSRNCYLPFLYLLSFNSDDFPELLSHCSIPPPPHPPANSHAIPMEAVYHSPLGVPNSNVPLYLISVDGHAIPD